MRMFFRLSLVSLRLPCLGSEISGVISTHTKLWVFIEISTRKKTQKQSNDEKENELTRAIVSRLSSALPVSTETPLERN